MNTTQYKCKNHYSCSQDEVRTCTYCGHAHWIQKQNPAVVPQFTPFLVFRLYCHKFSTFKPMLVDPCYTCDNWDNSRVHVTVDQPAVCTIVSFGDDEPEVSG